MSSVGVVFLNATQHELTRDQIKEIPKFISRFIGGNVQAQTQVLNLKDIAPELFNKLKNIKYGDNTFKLAIDLCNLVHEILTFKTHTVFKDVYRVFIHLPIGSPKFMFEFAIVLYQLADSRIIPVFSHSERVVEEKVNEKGEIIKVSRFKFNGFEEVDLHTIKRLM